MARLLGLDIGTTTIKLVEIEKNGKNNKLVTANLATSPPKGLLSEAAFDQAALVEAIKKIVSDAHINTKIVNVGLAEAAVFSRVIEMPQLSEKELASAIRWEAEQYIPLPLPEVILDYQVLLKNKGENSSNMDVFLVAAPKALVAKYENIIAQSGLEIVSIEPEAIALNRAVMDSSLSAPVTLVAAIGAENTTMFVSKKGNVSLTHSIATAGNALSRALSVDLGIDQMQAEEYKKTYGIKQEELSGKIGSSVGPLLQNLVSEIKRAMSFYAEKNKDAEPIRRIVLLGGSAKLPGLVVYLAEELGIETQIGDPWQKVSETQKLSALPFEPILFAQAVGLALKPL